MIRVLIADDHSLVREGLRVFLSEAEDIEPIGDAADGEEALRLAAQLRPDVVLMDLVLPRMDGIEVTRRLILALGKAAPRVILLTSFVDGARVREAIQAGAVGYQMKDLRREDLIQAVRAAAEGRPALHPEAQRHLMSHFALSAAPPPACDPTTLLASLTPREQDVLRLIAQGRSNKEIASELGLQMGTVKGYVSAILLKLEVDDRTQAALFAIKHGVGSDAVRSH